MEEKKSYYAIIPANVRYDKDLTPNAKLLYGEITALCNERGYCWSENSYFAELYGVSNTSISKWINLLVQKGYLSSEITYKQGTKQIDKRYLRIVSYPIEEKLNTPIEENFKENNTVVNNTSNNTVIEKKQQRKEIKTDALYEKFWKAYPNKVAKQYAKRFFVKLNPTEELVERMIRAIEQQKNTEKWRKDNGQYIPNPSTWLNQGRWEDEVMGANRYGTADEIEAENLREIERMERLVNGK